MLFSCDIALISRYTATMAKLDMAEVWADIKTYRRAYLLTAVASFGGMLFGWDTGLIGGMFVLTTMQRDLYGLSRI